MARQREPHDAFLDAFTGVDSFTSKVASDHTFDRFLSMIYGGATVRTYELADDVPADTLTMDRKALDWTEFRRVAETKYGTAVKPGALVGFRRKSVSQRIVEGFQLLSGGPAAMDVVAVVHNGMFRISPEAETSALVDALIARHLESFTGFTGSSIDVDRSEVDVLLRAHRRAVGAAIASKHAVSRDILDDYRFETEMERVTVVPGERHAFVRFDPSWCHALM
jgi:hypothetical protein